MLMLAAICSGIVQFLKNKYGTAKVGTQAIVLVLALVAAVAMWLLKHFDLWVSFAQILASMTMIYAFLIQHVEDAMKS